MIIKGPGVTGEVPLDGYILAMMSSAVRIGIALTIILYFLPDVLPWWSGFAGGVLIAVPVYAWHAIPDE